MVYFWLDYHDLYANFDELHSLCKSASCLQFYQVYLSIFLIPMPLGSDAAQVHNTLMLEAWIFHLK